MIKPRFSPLIIITVLFLWSCSEDDNAILQYEEMPILQTESCFKVETEMAKAGDTIHFINCSNYAYFFYWDFGDGSYSNKSQPTHVYKEEGSYRVRLIASTNNFSDTISSQINILAKPTNYFQYQDSLYKLTKVEILTGQFKGNYQFRILAGDNSTTFKNDSAHSTENAFCIVVDKQLANSTFALNPESYAIINGKKLALKNSSLVITEQTDIIKFELLSDQVQIGYSNPYSQNTLLNYPTYSILEGFIDKTFSHTTHTFNQYEELLDELSKDKYITVSINEMIDTYDNSKVVVGIRHDIDNHPFKALKMAQLEHKYNIKATHYVLATSLYYGYFTDSNVIRYKCMEDVYKEIYKLGHEIGIHNDLLAVMILHGLNPFWFNHNEIDFYNSLNIPIYGSVGHGSLIASQTVHNSQIFSDYAKSDFVEFKGIKYPIGEYSMAEYGFRYEANFIDMNMYFSDSGGSWNIDGGFSAVIDNIKNSKPGDRIQILVHPCWWAY